MKVDVSFLFMNDVYFYVFGIISAKLCEICVQVVIYFQNDVKLRPFPSAIISIHGPRDLCYIIDLYKVLLFF